MMESVKKRGREAIYEAEVVRRTEEKRQRGIKRMREGRKGI